MKKPKSLYEYFGKRVKIISIRGNEWHGYVDNYTSALDNDDENEESIFVKIDGEKERYFEFMAHEIKSIEIEEY